MHFPQNLTILNLYALHSGTAALHTQIWKYKELSAYRLFQETEHV